MERGKQKLKKKTSPATAFVSFTGSYTIEQFAHLMGTNNMRGKYAWIDTFCVDQFAWTHPKKNTEMIAYKEQFASLLKKITSIGYTALMLDKFDGIMSTLGQIWVIWEVFATTASSKTELKILLSNDGRNVSLEGLLRRPSTNWDVFEHLKDIERGKSRRHFQEDRKIIVDTMTKEGGLANVNNPVSRCLTEDGS